MIDLGISIYEGFKEYSLEQNLAYLTLAKEIGIDHVFSSAHINEATLDDSSLQKIIDECNKLDFKLSLDASKDKMDLIDKINNLYCLRLDYGFSDEDIIKMSNEKPYYLELNASTIKKDKLQKLINDGLNVNKVRLSFNFYPKLYTGHDIYFVKERTKELQDMGFYVSCFIPSLTSFRPPLYEGLPTVEMHRKQDLNLSIEELKACGINGIYFGDAYASKEELEILKFHACDELIIDVVKYQNMPNLDFILNNNYVIRPDYNNYLLRFSSSRLETLIEPNNNVKRNLYDLTIDNKLFKRYNGELNICLQDLPADKRCNVIGKAILSDIIVEKLKQGKRFKLHIKE